MKYGVQFYTLRELCKTAEGLHQCLVKVKQMGYDGLQLSATEAFQKDVSPEQFRQWIDEIGLECWGTHRPWNQLLTQTEAESEMHSVIGASVIGIGIAPNYCYEQGPKGWRQFVLEIPAIADEFEKRGQSFAFHNHAIDFERKEGERGMDILMGEADPRLQFILDTYWVVHAGADLIDVIQQLKGRIDLVHLKDKEAVGWETRFAPIGQGNLHWHSILPALNEAGAKYAVVELDDCFGRDPFDCLQQSIDFLHQ